MIEEHVMVYSIIRKKARSKKQWAFYTVLNTKNQLDEMIQPIALHGGRGFNGDSKVQSREQHERMG